MNQAASTRRPRGRGTRSRIARGSGTLALVIFALTAVVALATDNLHPKAATEALATGGGAPTATTPAMSGAATPSPAARAPPARLRPSARHPRARAARLAPSA